VPLKKIIKAGAKKIAKKVAKKVGKKTAKPKLLSKVRVTKKVKKKFLDLRGGAKTNPLNTRRTRKIAQTMKDPALKGTGKKKTGALYEAIYKGMSPKRKIGTSKPEIGLGYKKMYQDMARAAAAKKAKAAAKRKAKSKIKKGGK